MKPTLQQYAAPGWGVGEIWLDEDGVVVYSELPRPRSRGPQPRGSKRPSPAASAAHDLARRLIAWFAGRADDFADVELRLEDGFYGECARVLRSVPRGEVVTYGELAALAGHPGAARAAGTFCARCHLAPFLPVHRVVAAGGIGSWGGHGVDYKRRLLKLEGVAL
jgi:methylated-DNA-[protein]-cysteine S-methyltransferase